MWHEIFAGSYSFASFAIFQAIRKNKFPQIKNTANIFPAKIFATVNILYNLNSLHKQNGMQWNTGYNTTIHTVPFIERG